MRETTREITSGTSRDEHDTGRIPAPVIFITTMMLPTAYRNLVFHDIQLYAYTEKLNRRLCNNEDGLQQVKRYRNGLVYASFMEALLAA